MMKLLISLLVVLTIVNCDTASDVQKAFIDNEVIPDILKVPPKKFLDVTYPGGVAVNLGNELKPTQTKDAPNVNWAAEEGVYYTLIKVDPDAPTRNDPKLREFRHWLVMNILESDVKSGDEITQYIGAGAPKGTGLNIHRYIYLVFKQPNGKIEHNEPRATNRDIANRPMSSTLAFAQKYNLGDPVFGNFYQAQWDEYSDILLKQLQA